MDLQMPVLDGIGATRQIRALPNNRNVPIIALTANVFEEDQLLCDEVGMNDFIGRPVRAEELYDTLLEWLDARAG
jgi:CheY-like chemotaxis protein